MRPRLFILLLLLPLTCMAQGRDGTGDPNRRNPLDGTKIFQYYCAACHGADGRGPSSSVLEHGVPDLTLISRRNDGKFPRQRVRDLIEGEVAGPVVHGNREMPIWRPVFHEIEADQDWGEVRLDAVTKHLESIQKK